MAAPPTPAPVGIGIDLSKLTNFTPDLTLFHDALVDELTKQFMAAYRAMGAKVTESVLQSRAAEFALERAGELMSDLSETTRDMVGELVASSVESGRTLVELRNALQDFAGFGRQRAETIARTESAFALGRGQRSAAVDMGQDEKAWRGGECDECIGNDGDGWIGIDEPFGSGDDTVPAHPNCTCTVIYRTRRVHEEAVSGAIVKEAVCVACGRWVGRNMNADATAYCRSCKATKVRERETA